MWRLSVVGTLRPSQWRGDVWRSGDWSWLCGSSRWLRRRGPCRRRKPTTTNRSRAGPGVRTSRLPSSPSSALRRPTFRRTAPARFRPRRNSNGDDRVRQGLIRRHRLPCRRVSQTCRACDLAPTWCWEQTISPSPAPTRRGLTGRTAPLESASPFGSVQWTELLSTEIEVTVLGGPLLLEGRVALLVGFTPPDWAFSLGIGPAAGCEAMTTAGFNLFGAPSAGYSGNYVGGEARIDFLPGVGPMTAFPRARRSFDIGVVAVVWAPAMGAAQGRNAPRMGCLPGTGLPAALR